MAPDSCFFDEIPCDLKFSCNLPIRSRVDFCSEALGNPHLHPEQPEWSSDSGKSDEGINPLRRLKREMATSAAVEANRGNGQSSGNSGRSRIERAAEESSASLFGRSGTSRSG